MPPIHIDTLEGYSRSQHSEDSNGRRQRGQRMDLVGRKENSEDIATYDYIHLFSNTDFVRRLAAAFRQHTVGQRCDKSSFYQATWMGQLT